MKYKMIKRIPNTANRELNLVSRQQFAVEMVKVYQTYKRIVNIDETWINQTDFRRKCWRNQGVRQTLPKETVAPRISLIAGVDNFGEIYLCFTQTNTNGKVMNLFLSHFAKTMDSKDPKWRENTVFLFDGKNNFISVLKVFYFFHFRSKISPESLHSEKVVTIGDHSYLLRSPEL